MVFSLWGRNLDTQGHHDETGEWPILIVFAVAPEGWDRSEEEDDEEDEQRLCRSGDENLVVQDNQR